jgi:hypothetical protein
VDVAWDWQADSPHALTSRYKQSVVAIAAREKEAQATAVRYEQLVANLEEENRSVCCVDVLFACAAVCIYRQ